MASPTHSGWPETLGPLSLLMQEASVLKPFCCFEIIYTVFNSIVITKLGALSSKTDPKV